MPMPDQSAAAKAPAPPEFELELYVSGATPNSVRAVRNAKALCEKHLSGRYVLRVLDLYQQPELATRAQLVAAPTLLRLRPLPRRQLVGDLSNEQKVLSALGIG